MRDSRYTSWLDAENRIDLLAFWRDVGKRTREIWWILILLLAGGIFGGYFWEKSHYTPQYEAMASFCVSVEGQANSWSTGYYNRVSIRQLNATFPYLLTSGALQQVVAEDLGVAVVPAQISASVVGDTNIFQIRTVAGDAQTAYEVLQSVIKNYPEVAKYVVGDTQLQLLDEGGISSEPLNLPQYELRMLQGAVIASMVAALLVLFRTAACKTIKTAGELKSFLQTPCLAELPQVRLFRWGGRQMQESPHRLEDWPISYREALDTLQIRLLQILGKKQWKLLMVTSTLAGEGKTTTACNLALTLARKGYEVLLVDGDLRHPSVASALHLKEGKTGFCDVLHQRELVAEAIVTMEGNGLHVLPGRMPVLEPSDQYTPQELGELLAELRQMADYVIIDGPPCGILSDTVQMTDDMDAVLFVIRQDYGSREKILYGAELLAQSKAPLAGCVLNGTPGRGSSYYGRYAGKRYRHYGGNEPC